MPNGKEPYVTLMWVEKTFEHRAQFWKDYQLVDEKRLTQDEEEALDTYLSFVDKDSTTDVPASELWERYHDGDLLFDDDDNNFLWMLRQIMPEPVGEF